MPEFDRMEYEVIQSMSNNKGFIGQKNVEVSQQCLANLTPLVVVPWENIKGAAYADKHDN